MHRLRRFCRGLLGLNLKALGSIVLNIQPTWSFLFFFGGGRGGAQGLTDIYLYTYMYIYIYIYRHALFFSHSSSLGLSSRGPGHGPGRLRAARAGGQVLPGLGRALALHPAAARRGGEGLRAAAAPRPACRLVAGVSNLRRWRGKVVNGGQAVRRSGGWAFFFWQVLEGKPSGCGLLVGGAKWGFGNGGFCFGVFCLQPRKRGYPERPNGALSLGLPRETRACHSPCELAGVFVRGC